MICLHRKKNKSYIIIKKGKNLLEFNVYKIPLTQCYLEMSRSILLANVREKKNKQSEKSPINLDLSFRIAFASLTTIYSYMAIESFMNYALYELWSHSRLAHNKIEEINQKFPELKSTPIYDEFYKKYGYNENFIKLKNTELGKIKEKIKILCSNLGFKQIYEVNQPLWQDFLGLLEKTRDFLIHPIPEKEIFNKFCKDLTENDKLFYDYPRIATEIIRYFYLQSKTKPPEFLENNRLFFISEIVKM
jgi:hypothetical protein